MTNPRDGSLERELAAIVGDEHVLIEADLMAGYSRDITGRFSGEPRSVVRPATGTEVAAVVRLCAVHGASLVPQGGNTGLVGASVPRSGEVLLSLRRLDHVGQVDQDAGQLDAGAGATLERVQQQASAAGWAFNVDHGARSAATIGGMIATNAGGTQVLRHGTMRAHVAGLEVVLASGDVLRRMEGLAKDATGYDLAGLMCGAEGTLGIITAARLRLGTPPGERVTALFALADAAAGMVVFRTVRQALRGLQAAEFFQHDGLELVCRHRRLAAPFADDHRFYLLLEADGGDEALEQLAAAVEPLEQVRDVAAATDAPTREALWAYRELQNEAIAAEAVPHKLDVSLPLSTLAAFLERVAAVAGAAAAGGPGATASSALRTILFGHLGDGNVHVNLLGLDRDDRHVEEAVLQLVRELGGSIGAEHGIGIAKARWLHLSRSRAELAAMRTIKDALDPGHMLNPGVLLPPPFA